MKKTTLVCLFLSALAGNILLSSCDRFENDQTIPAYIHIDTILLVTDPGSQGTASHKITDAWVYIDDALIGAFELPCTFPVLEEGTHDLKVLAGIKMNGIAATRVYYPFFKAWNTSITLEPESTLAISPVVSYYDNAIFAWMEDFEDGGSSLEKTSKSDTNLILTSVAGQVFQGNYSGLISLGDSAKIFEASTINSFKLPLNKAVFLELNYKTNNLLTVGLFGDLITQIIQEPMLVLNHSDKWNKVYINVTPFVAAMPTADNFKIFFGVAREDTVSNPTALIDNIKLIHF